VKAVIGLKVAYDALDEGSVGNIDGGELDLGWQTVAPSQVECEHLMPSLYEAFAPSCTNEAACPGYQVTALWGSGVGGVV